MVEHYFKVPLTAEQWYRLETALSNPPGVADLTPAEVCYFNFYLFIVYFIFYHTFYRSSISNNMSFYLFIG